MVEASFCEHLLVVEQMFGAVEDGYAIQPTPVHDRTERRRRYIGRHRIGDEVGQIIHPTCRGELGRPHRVHLDYIDVGAAEHDGVDLIQALMVWDNGLNDRDASSVGNIG
jgi:hypothetical protein